MAAPDNDLPKPAKLRQVFAASATSNFDRFAVGPMLVAIAASFDVNLSTASLVATAYFMAYGLSQPFWGAISDRHGRIATIRIALLVGALANVVSAFAPSLIVLVASRTVAGIAFGAIVPAAITYIGDNTAADKRQRTLSDMLAAMAIGNTMATLVSGVATDISGWRPMFGIISLTSALLWSQLPARGSVRTTRISSGRPLAAVARVMRSGWAILVIVLATLEGALVLGLFALLPSAIEQHHKSAAFAGSLVAVYGISVLATTPFTKRLSSQPIRPILLGGSFLVAASFLPFVLDGVYPLVLCAAFLGVTWSALHSSLQTWMTMTVPSERATCVALMTSGLFFGSGVGSALGAHLIDQRDFHLLFGIWTITSCVLTVAAVNGRRLFSIGAY